MRPFLATGLVAIALVSGGCLFGGDGDPEPTATSVPPAPTDTPAAAADTPTPPDPTATSAPVQDTATPDPSAPTEYTVQEGDFLSIIAANFGISVEALAEANGIDDPDKIFVGQVLIIPASQ